MGVDQSEVSFNWLTYDLSHECCVLDADKHAQIKAHVRAIAALEVV
ncbi:MAG: hypothetical protein F6K50_11690 [Moorea sp. SIO3I7]|nr:hypothetical protein [Moorena sp. SIO3I8]NEN96167.1 hypothetical protein [Moorena sp. SIO3I7]NEO10067.1 hypothetical protein [Moorena sp. SIO3I8]